jgi:glycosyltransferase involved in cell wall biosynthesis
MKPFISIIMPVYNNECYFPKAVESILQQTFNDWELIIVDDGSTDNTPAIADSIAENDSRIHVIHQKNQWIYASFNNGIAQATGKYVFIVNSDDTINPNSLSMFHEASNTHNPDIMFFNMIIHKCDMDQNIIESDIWNYSKYISKDFYTFGEDNIRNNWCEFMQKKLVFRQCVYRTSIAKKHKFRNDVYIADQMYNADIASEIYSAVGISYVVYNHFHYVDNKKMNASIGKYYGYEHSMFNELYTKYVDLFRSWGLWNDRIADTLAAKRLNDLTLELRSLMAKNCTLKTDEKLYTAFVKAIDDIVYTCANNNGRTEELESRVLCFCNELFESKLPDESSEYYFVYELLDSLLRYEKAEEDMEKIKNAIYHKNNPYHIGESFYKKLIN